MRVTLRSSERMVDLKSAIVGDYDYGYMCLPSNPWKKGGRTPPPFYAVDAPLSLLVALFMGLQHSLAMVGGIVTPPLIVGFATQDSDVRQYLISASLIVSGLMTFVQVTQFKIPGTKYAIGTGLISVMGTSFTFLPIAQESIGIMKSEDGLSFNTAYGKLLGTILVCVWLEVALSFLPPKVIRRIFPPIVTGVTITLIGVSLTGTGLRYWGGGVSCSFGAPLCFGNGDVKLSYGSAEYIGLGLIVLCTLIFIEVFGSPFMRNIGVVLALLFGFFISAVVTKDGNHYVTTDKMDSAPALTFLWVETFPLGFYAPALIPLLIGFVVTTIETVGDITASAEASGLDAKNEEDMKPRVQEVHTRMTCCWRAYGGVLSDGLSSFFAALATTLPNTTFSQNNGVIALTRTASRYAGWACSFWLVLFGILGKVGAFFLTILDCVLGGMTTFLFANVMVSGLRIVGMQKITRRSRLILAVSLGVGVGVSIVPKWANNNLWTVTEGMSTFEKGLRDGVILTLETGYAVGALLAVLLNTILPTEKEDDSETESAKQANV